jgi:hypothetical protein
MAARDIIELLKGSDNNRLAMGDWLKRDFPSSIEWLLLPLRAEKVNKAAG